MRIPLRVLVVAALVLVTPTLATAQGRKKPQIGMVRVGFPVGSERNRPVTERGYFKSGAWTPVYVDLTAGEAGLNKARLVVETADYEDTPASYSVPLRRLDPNEAVTNVLVYAKPGSLN